MDKWRSIAAGEADAEVDIVKKRLMAAAEWRLQYIKSYVVGPRLYKGCWLLCPRLGGVDTWLCVPCVCACVCPMATAPPPCSGAARFNANFVPVQQPDA